MLENYIPIGIMILCGAAFAVVMSKASEWFGPKNPNEIKEAMKDHKGMVEAWDRMAAHLAKNDVDIAKDKVTLGVPLKMDTKTERFLGNAKANEMLSRNYRVPYVVPEKV